MKKMIWCAGFMSIAAGLMVSAQIVVGGVSPKDVKIKPIAPKFAVGEKFATVPISDLTPAGWHKELLKRQKSGLTGHPKELGYPFDTVMWQGIIDIKTRVTRKDGAAWFPYEQAAYFLDGALRASYLLKDEDLRKISVANIKHTLKNPAKNGRLGPKVKDLRWPRVVFFRMLMAEYEATHDPKILEALGKHYICARQWMSGGRTLLHLEVLCWLYKHTGDKRFLKYAEENFDRYNKSRNHCLNVYGLNSDKPITGHGVSVTEAIKIPAIMYMYTKKDKYLQASINGIKKLYRDHGLGTGMYSCSEFVSGKASNELHETCDIADMLWSLGYIFQASGDVQYADLMEKIFLNAGIGALGRDFRNFQYYSGPNIFAIPALDKSHGSARLRRINYLPQHDTECCAGNISRLAPNFFARMWMKTPEKGLAAVLYGPTKFVTKLGDVGVEIVETTKYPFEDQINFEINPEMPVEFPLSLRIPAWVKSATIKLNGKVLNVAAKPGTFATVKRKFEKGDKIQLTFECEFKQTKAGLKNKGVVLSRGPLVYSLPIKADRKPVTYWKRKSENFTGYAYLPTSKWNFALNLNDLDLKKLKIVESDFDTLYPWDAPKHSVSVPACLIKNWKLKGKYGTPKLPGKVEKSNDEQIIKLVPYGATFLRLTIFPVTK